MAILEKEKKKETNNICNINYNIFDSKFNI